MPADGKFMTVEEVAGYLGFEKQTIYNKVHSKEIPFHKIGPKAVRFKKEEIDAWIESLRVFDILRYIKKGDKYYLEISTPPEPGEATTATKFLSQSIPQVKAYWKDQRLPFEFNNADLQTAKGILDKQIIYPYFLKNSTPVYAVDPPDVNEFVSYVTLWKILQEKSKPERSPEEVVTLIQQLYGRLSADVHEEILRTPQDLLEREEAYVGYKAADFASKLLHEFRRIMVYLEYGHKATSDAYSPYANRYFSAETLFLLYLDGYCSFIRNPFSEERPVLRDKTLDELTPSQFTLGLSLKLFSTSEVHTAVIARVRRLETEVKALKSIASKTSKGAAHGRKN